MPLITRKKRQLNKEMKNREYRDNLASETGIYFSSELTSAPEGFPFLKYIVNALILFGATFGSLYCLITSFELNVTVVPMAVTCVFSALVLSFMYADKRAKIIVYLLILSAVITCAFRFFTVINSGVSAIRNNILRYVDTRFDLPFLREYDLRYDDEFTAMSIAFCVLAVAIMILINIVVSEKMSLRGIFALTFPVVQFGMYFNFNASKFAMLCVVASWILVAGVNLTNSYNGLTRKMVSSSSVKKHRHSYGFITDSKNIAAVAVTWLLFICILTGVVFAAVPSDEFEVNLPTNSIKTSTERTAKNILSYGLTSLYSVRRDSSSPGQLANVSSISFDGRTDLRVTLVNYRAERMYLRNYAGYKYDSESMRWLPSGSETEDRETAYNLTGDILDYDFENGQELTQSSHRIEIKIMDYDLMAYPFNVPYYTSLKPRNGFKYLSGSSVTALEGSEISPYDSVEFVFHTIDTPSENYTEYTENIKDSETRERIGSALEDARKDAYENALYVPEVNLEAMEKFCEAYGISKDGEDPVAEVVSALETDFDYTLKPGKIPYGEDYINYFLLGSQKGYCQHFASAATMLFRYLGIPARYCEGYVVDYNDYYNAATLLEEDYTEWITTPYVSDLTVSQVNIPDSSGHAWVEIYTDGIGWIPVEATKAASADEGPGLLATLFGGANRLTAGSQRMMERVRNLNSESTRQNLIRLVITVVSLAFVIYLFRVLKAVIKRHKSFRNKKQSAALSSRYASLYETWLHSLNEKPAGNLSYMDFCERVSEGTGISGAEFCEKTESVIFGGYIPSGEEYRKIISDFGVLRKETVRKMTSGKKFSYYFVKVLW